MPRESPMLTHWGAFRVVREGDRLTDVRPIAGDAEPSAIGQSLLDTRDHPLRITRPMVRAGYLRGERGPTCARGTEPFVAVDWPTANALVGGALLEVRARHGNGAIYAGSYGWASAGRFHQPQAQLHRFLSLFGGFTGSRHTYSTGAAEVLLPHVLMPLRSFIAATPGWAEVAAHARLVLAFGGLAAKNSQVNFGGVARHRVAAGMQACREAGVRIVSLSPLRDDAPETAGAEWVPLRPGSDTAVMLAMAHVLVVEGLIDRDFVERCCEGFEPFRAYLLGEAADRTAKTPEWAAALSGVPAARIAELARALASTRSLLSVSWSVQRADHGEQPIWAAVALAALAGSMGKPGGGLAIGANAMHSLGSGTPSPALPALPSPPNPIADFIPSARLADMLLHPGEPYPFDGTARRYPDIRLVYWAGGNPFHHHQQLGRLVRAWRRPETVIVHEPFWTATARHADIVLPCATALERNDLGAGANDGWLLAMKQALPPPEDARSDHAIFAGLAAQLGFEQAFTEGLDEMGWLRWLYATAHERWSAHGIHLPDFERFWAAEQFGISLPQSKSPPCAALRDDPAAHPLPTPSGKVELASRVIAGFNTPDCPGHPAWLPPREWLGSDAAIRYPLHLVSNQPATRLHSQLDFGRTSKSTKRDGREPCRIHPADAAQRGIRHGDVVRLFNDRGACFCVALVTDRVMPGVVALATGAWFDPERPGDPWSACRHGNPNSLTRDAGTSSLAQATAAQSCLVQLERVAPENAPEPHPFEPPEIIHPH